ncbi:hypothetical protein [Flaviaesturariibacter aridisoli]|uniref:Uncharacterized protein n=1 Tax=Flaviaesturariibacter aridisoli TaxID=2545761 RepID=A0A4R4DZA2_9BACT|nr:hypothetical protein [Flaviaesturariibacter aridisoli]TCZ69583.1 hypothetical protein E0486_12195 [Flaviaesturariibacter aridisoli]
MSKKIASYDDLVEEKARLEELLGLQKAAIKGSLNSLQEDVRPVTNGLLVVTRILTKIGKRNRPTSPLLNVGLDIGVDMVLRRYLLRKAGWFSRTFVPLVASTLIARFLNSEKETAFTKKMKNFFANLGKHPDTPPDMTKAADMEHDGTN